MSETIILIIAVVAAIALIAYPWRSRLIRKNLGRREEIDVGGALVKRFGEAQIDLTAAADLWRSLATCFELRPGQLRLSDRFAVELDSKRIITIDDELSCVNVVLARFASQRQANVDLSTLKTIEDCIIALCRSTAK